VVALAEAGQGLATQTDRDEFRYTFMGLGEGNHRLDVVAYEATRAEPSITTLTGIRVEINHVPGKGNLDPTVDLPLKDDVQNLLSQP